MKLSKFLDEKKKELSKLEYILEKYPDADVFNNGMEFRSKHVNTSPSNVEFRNSYMNLYLSVYDTIDFLGERIRIYSSPRYNTLLYINRINKRIKFSRFTINLSKHGFNRGIIEQCQKSIFDYLSENPSYSIDEKHITTNIKKLLPFL